MSFVCFRLLASSRTLFWHCSWSDRSTLNLELHDLNWRSLPLPASLLAIFVYAFLFCLQPLLEHTFQVMNLCVLPDDARINRPKHVVKQINKHTVFKCCVCVDLNTCWLTSTTGWFFLCLCAFLFSSFCFSSFPCTFGVFFPPLSISLPRRGLTVPAMAPHDFLLTLQQTY